VAVEVTGERQAQATLELREARFQALVQRSADAAFITDDSGAIQWASPAVHQVLGFRPEEVVGLSGYAGVHPDDVDLVQERWAQVAAGRPQPAFEHRVRTADGQWIWVEQQLTNLLDEPAVCGVVSNLRDITARRQANASLAASEQRYRTIVESAGEGICIYDAEQRVVLANPRLRAMVGDRPFEAITDLVHPDDLALAVEHLERQPLGLTDSYELRLVHAEGQPVHVLVTGNPLVGPDGAPEGGLLMVADITERKRAEVELSRLALTDTVTGLPNRTLIVDRLNQALVRGERHGHRVAAMFLDVDQFKLVNDSLGHLAGDVLLAAVAERLSAAVRSAETTVGRLGGDEFVILCDNLLADADAVKIANRVHEALAEPFRLGADELYVTVSIGVAFGPPGDSDMLLSHADAAMYRAKQAGRARTELFDDELREVARARLQLLTELRSAVESDQLGLAYQPVLDLATGRVLGVEALVRWHHPSGRIVAPGAFIGAAEESGLIVEMGATVLRLALQQAARWSRAGMPLELSVNLSARQLTDPSLVERVATALAASGVDAAGLCLEITESALIDVDAAVEVMTELRRLGVRLAIDDFGTGYSSLTYLSRLPVDVLKIDRAFIAPLPSQGEPFVAAITSLARAVGVTSVAEGVESAAQADALRRLGCHAAQGFLWSQPVKAAAVPDLVRRLTLGLAGRYT
jgi:diguanylate cyclase (GGDEF)-like protein/PAS domain S-box-containing protein